VRDQHADRTVACAQRHVQAGARTEPTSDVLIHLWILEQRVDALAATALEDASRLRVVLEQLERRHFGSAVAVSCRDAQARGARQRDRDEPRADQLAQPARDEVEEWVELELADERGADLVQRLELL
jgi:hypothetical protein